MRFRKHFKAFLFCLAVLGLSACGPTGEHEPSFGDAWVAPATLQVRKELTLHAPVSMTLHHGDHVDLLARRRRFIKIRASNGAEGWTDSRLLLSADAMDKFQDLQDRAAAAPSLGRATVLDTVTVHTAPYRQAPALYQIAPKQSVEIIAHQRVQRLPWDPPPLLDELALRPKASKKKKEPPKVPLPPPGPAPAVPDDWLLLSGYPQDRLPGEKPNEPPPEPPAPPVLDDWTLVRWDATHAGWVLDRLLYLSIPDEVIQYAERARIVAYYEIGSIRDGDVVKPVWLWASQSAAAREIAFDSLRIFTWSTRRHRWETSWIEHGAQGVGPVTLVRDGQHIKGFRTYAIETDGKVMRREYALQNNRARIISRVDERPPAPWYVAPPKVVSQPGAFTQAVEELPFGQKVRRWFNHLRAGSSH
jgi:hypothetical protein